MPEQADRSHVTVSLICENAKIQPGIPFTVGLHFVLDEHWHIYWHNPGDAGMGPRVTWELPQGFQVSELRWPAPHPIHEDQLVAFGYTQEVILSAQITPPNHLPIGDTFVISAKIDWLVCDQICLAGSAQRALTLTIAPKPMADRRATALFERHRKQLPTPSSLLGWHVSAKWQGESLDILLTPPDNLKFLPASILFFPDQGGFMNNAGIQTVQPQDGALVLRVPLDATSSNRPDRITGLLVADEGGWSSTGDCRAMQIDVPLTTH